MSWTTVAGCAEEYGTQSESYDLLSGGATCKVVLRCPYADRYNVVNDLYNGGDYKVWPLIANSANITNIDIAPVLDRPTQSGGVFTYQQALITLTYKTPSGSTNRERTAGGQLYSEEIVTQTEFITLDWKLFRWKTSPADLLMENESPGKQLKTLTLKRTLYELTSIPATILSLAGKVNSASYTSATLGLTFAAQTLLFGDPNMQRSVKVDGTKAWTLSLNFVYKPDTWNKFWRGKTQAYDTMKVIETDADYLNYPTASFSDFLF